MTGTSPLGPPFSPSPSVINLPSYNDVTGTSIPTQQISTGNIASAGSGNPNFDRLVQVIYTIIGIAFNAFCIWKAGYLWGVSFFIGMIFREEVKTRITDYVKSIFSDPKLFCGLIGGYCLFLVYLKPAVFTMQAVIAGADAGSRFALWIEGLVKKNQDVPRTIS